MAANGKDRLKQTGRRITAKQKQIISSMYRPLCRIFILIGIATLLLAVVVIWQYRSSTQRTAKTTGVITEIDKVNGIGRMSLAIMPRNVASAIKLLSTGMNTPTC